MTWQRYPDPDIEALAVGEQILRLNKRGAAFRDMAVLYRTNAQSEAFERHFAALEIPFTIREDGDFYARKEVQGILAYLNFFAGANEEDEGGRMKDEKPTTPHSSSLILTPTRRMAPRPAQRAEPQAVAQHGGASENVRRDTRQADVGRAAGFPGRGPEDAQRLETAVETSWRVSMPKSRTLPMRATRSASFAP